MKKIFLILVLFYVGSAFGSLIYDDNGVHTLDFVYEIDSGSVVVFNNTTVNVIDGADFRLGLRDNSTAYITGGKIRGMGAFGTSTACITGGDFRYLGDHYFSDNSVIHIKGGLFWAYEEGVLAADTSVKHNASMIFYGTDFTYETVDRNGSFNTYYYISGILESGDVLDNFRISVGPDAAIQFIPEPCTLAMLALGGVLIRRRRAA